MDDYIRYRCKDCAYLVEDDHGNWFCDSAGNRCIEIPIGECPEHVDKNKLQSIIETLGCIQEGLNNLAEHSAYDMRKDTEELSYLVKTVIDKLEEIDQ